VCTREETWVVSWQRLSSSVWCAHALTRARTQRGRRSAWELPPVQRQQQSTKHRHFTPLDTVNSVRKGKNEYLYSAIYILCISQSAHAWITQFYLQIHHACLSSLRKRSPNGATSNWGEKHPIAAHYSSIDSEGMKGWVGLVGWPIADGLPT